MPDLFVYLAIGILAGAVSVVAWFTREALREIDRIHERLEP